MTYGFNFLQSGREDPLRRKKDYEIIPYKHSLGNQGGIASYPLGSSGSGAGYSGRSLLARIDSGMSKYEDKTKKGKSNPLHAEYPQGEQRTGNYPNLSEALKNSISYFRSSASYKKAA
ncbi:hypothetical protein J4408_00575 [Candidatus Pacearchaeota archaeon]|nr:hypothetical protein [Candidatus Pacearchaeota archaeon]